MVTTTPPAIVTGCQSVHHASNGVVGSLVSSLLSRSNNGLIQGAAYNFGGAINNVGESDALTIGLQSTAAQDIVSLTVVVDGIRAVLVPTVIPAHQFATYTARGAGGSCRITQVKFADGSYWYPASN